MSNSSTASKDGLSVCSYVGDGAVLLAFDLEEDKTSNLAGFAIQCTTPNKGPYTSNTYWLKNRLSLREEITKDTETLASKREDSIRAPFQLFHWIHFPGSDPGEYEYTVYASYFKSDGTVEIGPKASVKINLNYKSFSFLELGFTRGYISSQAYADRFQNKGIEPEQKSISFSTTPYIEQYKWLGAHARKLIFNFLEECLQDNTVQLDVEVYDFDEPDIIRALCQMGKRVRVFQDNATLHTDPGSMELNAISALKAAGVNVKTGHFNRQQHNKVMIQKKQGKAIKVLTGSANFSLRGLYVQANSVLVFDDPIIADLYEQAFEQGFSGENDFKVSNIASKWFEINNSNNKNSISLSFAPHQEPFTIRRVSDSIRSARSSVFFSLMQMTGGGDVAPLLKDLRNRNEVFSLGTTESTTDLQLFRPGMDDNAAIVPFSYLKQNVPKLFKNEWDGGPGRVIHHKFVVCDFNDKNPVVYCGSSNLSAGGEVSNGDNLIAIYDDYIPTFYAVEAIRLFDHYKFRSLKENSTSNSPLKLDTTDEWKKRYYDSKDIKFLERKLLSHIPE